MVSNSETLSLFDLRICLEVAQRLSVTGAADALGLPKSAVSKALARLEAQLGVRLLERSSRRVRVTPAGELLRSKAEALLSEADFLVDSLRGLRDEARGPLRMTAPPELGAWFVEQVMPAVVRSHPDLRVALRLGYAFDDLQDPAIDLALRVGAVHDERLVGVPLAGFARVAVASPAYLAAHPVHHPEDLARHACLVFSDHQHEAQWTFEQGGRPCTVAVRSVLSVQGFTALLQAARAGLGVARAPAFAAAPYLQRGELQAVLPDWQARPAQLYAVHRFGHQRMARVAALLQVLRTLPGLAASLGGTHAQPPAGS